MVADKGHVDNLVCPHCGYCPTCGRPGGYQLYPMWPQRPYGPTVISNITAVDSAADITTLETAGKHE